MIAKISQNCNKMFCVCVEVVGSRNRLINIMAMVLILLLYHLTRLKPLFLVNRFLVCMYLDDVYFLCDGHNFLVNYQH